MATEVAGEIVIQGNQIMVWFALGCFGLVGWVIRSSLGGLKDAVKSSSDSLKAEFTAFKTEMGERVGSIEDSQQQCQVGLARDLGSFVRRDDHQRDVDQIYGRINGISREAMEAKAAGVEAAAFARGVSETLNAMGRKAA